MDLHWVNTGDGSNDEDIWRRIAIVRDLCTMCWSSNGMQSRLYYV